MSLCGTTGTTQSHKACDACARPLQATLLSMLYQVVAGLEYLHRQGVIHGGAARRRLIAEACSGQARRWGGEPCKRVPAAACRPDARQHPAQGGQGGHQRHHQAGGEGGASCTFWRPGHASCCRSTAPPCSWPAQDFGLSQRLDAQATHVSNFNAGTPFYVAPEVVAMKRTSPASDIFSFGVVAW